MGLFDAYQSPDWFQVLCAVIKISAVQKLRSP